MLPVRFVYLENTEKVYVSILGQFKHHFTGETIYRVRREGESGWVGEELYGEKNLINLLRLRVEE